MDFKTFLQSELKKDLDHHLERKLAPQNKKSISFSLNDYLGIASQELLTPPKTSISRASGAGAARLAGGNRDIHREVEQAISQFKGTEASLLYPTGYMAAMGVIPSLVRTEDLVVLDKLSHACLLDGAKLSGARMRIFTHNDLEMLEDILKKERTDHPQSRILVIVESVYSMDGDLAPLQEIVDLKNKYSAWLWVDEAHGTGVFGKNRRGLCEKLGVADQVEIQMGTLGKALGVQGGYLTGKQELIDLLINRSRSFLFTTGFSPLLASYVLQSIHLVSSDEGQKLYDRLWRNVKHFRELLQKKHLSIESPSMIFPMIAPDIPTLFHWQKLLGENGITVPAIRPPTVPAKSPRLRISINASHTKQEIETLVNALSQLYSTS